MATYSRWIYIAVAAMFVTGAVTYYGMAPATAKSVLIKACAYWETKGISHWCNFEHIKITKCDKQLYLVKTENSQCGDLIITGGGGLPYYTMMAYKRSAETQDRCGYVYYGGCT